jgi:hypothetical protein
LGVYLFAQNIILASPIVVLLLVANGTEAPVAAGITPIPMELLNTRLTDFFNGIKNNKSNQIKISGDFLNRCQVHLADYSGPLNSSFAHSPITYAPFSACFFFVNLNFCIIF